MDIANTQIINPAEPFKQRYHRVWAKRLCLAKVLLAVPLVICFWVSFGVALVSLCLSFASGLVGLTHLQSEKQLRRSGCCAAPRKALKAVLIATTIDTFVCPLAIVATIFAFIGGNYESSLMLAFGIPCIAVLAVLFGVEIACWYHCWQLSTVGDSADIFRKPDVVIVQTLNPTTGTIDQYVVELRQQPEMDGRLAAYQQQDSTTESPPPAGGGVAGGLETVPAPDGRALNLPAAGAPPPPPGFGVVMTPTTPAQQYGAMQGVVAPIVRHNNTVQQVRTQLAAAQNPPEARLPVIRDGLAPPQAGFLPHDHDYKEGGAHHSSSSSDDDGDDEEEGAANKENAEQQAVGAADPTSTNGPESPQRVAQDNLAVAAPTVANNNTGTLEPISSTTGRDTPTPSTIQYLQQQQASASSTAPTPVMTSPNSAGAPSYSSLASAVASPTGVTHGHGGTGTMMISSGDGTPLSAPAGGRGEVSNEVQPFQSTTANDFDD